MLRGVPLRGSALRLTPLRRRPAPFDRDRFVGAWPGRHRDRDEGQGGRLVRAKLEMGAKRDRHGRSGLSGTTSSASPCLRQSSPAPGHDVPDLLDGPVRDGLRDPAGGQLEMGEAAAGEGGQEPNRGAVGRDRIGLGLMAFVSNRFRIAFPVGAAAARLWRGEPRPAKRKS